MVAVLVSTMSPVIVSKARVWGGGLKSMAPTKAPGGSGEGPKLVSTSRYRWKAHLAVGEISR